MQKKHAKAESFLKAPDLCDRAITYDCPITSGGFLPPGFRSFASQRSARRLPGGQCLARPTNPTNAATLISASTHCIAALKRAARNWFQNSWNASLHGRLADPRLHKFRAYKCGAIRPALSAPPAAAARDVPCWCYLRAWAAAGSARLPDAFV